METEKRRKFIIDFAYFMIWAAIAVAILKFGMSSLAPFVLAAVLAYLLHRPMVFLGKKLRLGYRLSAIIVVILFYAVIGTIISLVGFKLVSGIVAFFSNLPNIYSNHLEAPLAAVFDNLDRLLLQFDSSLHDALVQLESQLVQTLGSVVSTISVSAMSFVSNMAASLPGLFIKLVLLIISTFFISIDYEKLTSFCMNQFTGRRREIFIQIKGYVIGTLFVCIRSYALIMFITFVELSIGLTIIGIRHAVLIALCISVFDILPVLGTGGIMIPWTILSLVQGRLSLALGLLIIYVAITVIRNIIEPKIVGSQLGLHPIVTLASMFLGVQLFGVIGLFGFPIGLSLICHLNGNGTIRLFNSGPSQ